MIRPDHDESVKFFTGTEVEHTPALGKKTLFVVGVQTEDDIAAHLTGCEHIYFGANQSFPNYDINARGWLDWENMILPFLDRGYLCTLDIDVKSVEGLLESGFTEYHNFIPMISVKLPYIRQLGYNATLKLDDKDFAATNPGVWCHSVHKLQNRTAFTDWSKYTKDETL
jgi:hypothetical protein